MTTPRGRPALDRFLGPEAADAGCAATMALLDEYVEAVAGGRDPEATMPGVAAHLRSCQPCINDFDGLLAAVRHHDDRAE